MARKSSIEALCLCKGIDKSSTDLYCFLFQFERGWSIIWGELSPPSHQTWLAVIHLNIKEAQLELNINETSPFWFKHIYLGGMLDRLLTHHRHLKVLCKSWHHALQIFEAVCWLWLKCWSNNAANSHLSLVTFNIRELRSGAAVLTLASLTLPSMAPCEVKLDACILHRRTTFLFTQASNLLRFVAKEPNYPCSTQLSPVHLLRMPGISNQDTHFVPAAPQLIWWQ